MGIAWFDDEPPSMNDPVLRTGGLPLMSKEQAWPCCQRCDLPMLFRAQVPLALTSLVSSEDSRILLLFECHAAPDSCEEGKAFLVQSGGLSPVKPPVPVAYDVVLRSAGPDPERIRALLAETADEEPSFVRANEPVVFLHASPPALAQETARAVEELGGVVELCPFPKVALPYVHGGQLVPFDDGREGVRKTTLPPLRDLVTTSRARRMRGLLGGATPGYRDYSLTCDCGRPTRTAVRLLALHGADAKGVPLSPAVVQVCLSCSIASLHRGVAYRSANNAA